MTAERSHLAAQPTSPTAANRRETWATGDYGIVATRIVLVAEQLCESADLQATWRVLDVATGTGNAALAAARRGCRVIGLDFVPALLEQGRRRAAVERLEVEFVEGDAENLPFADGEFDAVISVFGVMFAPDHRRAAAEMARVCRRGGRIALASWTPNGYAGQMFKTIVSRVPPSPGVQPPVLWGDESHLRELFSGLATIDGSVERMAVLRAPSAEEHVEFFRTNFGPMIRGFAALDAAGQEELRQALVALARQHDRNRGLHGPPVAMPSAYLETVLTRV